MRRALGLITVQFMRPLSSLEPETANTRLSQRCKKFTVHPRHAAITPGTYFFRPGHRLLCALV